MNDDDLTTNQKIFILIGILIMGAFFIWGMVYPWKTEKQYISNLHWKRVIAEKYDVENCGYEIVSKLDGDGNIKTSQEYKCHTTTYTVNTFTRKGTWKDEVKWPEYHIERDDSYLDRDEFYYVVFKSDNSKNVLTLYRQKEWQKYHMEDLYLVTTSPFGIVVKTNRIVK